MNPSRRRVLALGAPSVLAAAGLVAGPRQAHAQDYPSRGVRVVTGFTGGAASDVIARLVAEHLSRDLGQTFTVDPRPGAQGTIAATAIARAPNDGYTIGIGTPSSHVTASALIANLPYDAQRDFTAIALLAKFPFLLAVNASTGVTSVPQLIERLRAQPNTFNFGSLGEGTGPHLGGELFKLRTGTEMVHVAYSDNGPMVADFIAGRIQVMFYSLPSLAGHVREGRVRLLAVTQPQRWRRLPDLPAIAEVGVSNFEVTGWMGMFGPAGVPADAVNRINASVDRSLQREEVIARFDQVGAVPGGGPPSVLASHMANEIAALVPLMQRLNVRPR